MSLPRILKGEIKLGAPLSRLEARVALETLRFEDLGGGRTRLHAQSLVESFQARDGWLASGMEVGVNEGYAALDRLLAQGAI